MSRSLEELEFIRGVTNGPEIYPLPKREVINLSSSSWFITQAYQFFPHVRNIRH